MRRDMELVRKILIAVEDCPPGTANPPIDGYDQETIVYHVRRMKEAGLLQAAFTMGNPPNWIAMNLTWEGHEFLDAARNEAVWKKAWSNVVSSGGSVSLVVLKELLVNAGKQYFLGND